jgi:hypothetical protein
MGRWWGASAREDRNSQRLAAVVYGIGGLLLVGMIIGAVVDAFSG